MIRRRWLKKPPNLKGNQSIDQTNEKTHLISIFDRSVIVYFKIL